ncbi:MAG TPA: GNAT family N-acetyltransferase, partial [Candidatus Hydrogenedentes bacterium]|nr:GNAT family N-acetyltransferase [Candidatus Hydrogenedentota bacterium]
MQFVRIKAIDDPLFPKMHALMQTVFPPEEVLDFELWREPLQDNGLRVCVAVHDGEVVGATEYRYYPDMNVAMTDFTIIGREGLGIGRFLYLNRGADLRDWAN